MHKTFHNSSQIVLGKAQRFITKLTAAVPQLCRSETAAALALRRSAHDGNIPFWPHSANLEYRNRLCCSILLRKMVLR